MKYSIIPGTGNEKAGSSETKDEALSKPREARGCVKDDDDVMSPRTPPTTDDRRRPWCSLIRYCRRRRKQTKGTGTTAPPSPSCEKEGRRKETSGSTCGTEEREQQKRRPPDVFRSTRIQWRQVSRGGGGSRRSSIINGDHDSVADSTTAVYKSGVTDMCTGSSPADIEGFSESCS